MKKKEIIIMAVVIAAVVVFVLWKKGVFTKKKNETETDGPRTNTGGFAVYEGAPQGPRTFDPDSGDISDQDGGTPGGSGSSGNGSSSVFQDAANASRRPSDSEKQFEFSASGPSNLHRV